MASPLFQTTNPARGRKPGLHSIVIFISSITFQTTNPARGRKLFRGGDQGGRCCDFKPQTPQGDGNICNNSDRLLHTPFLFQTTNPARGRKRVPLCLDKLPDVISNHKPRKGTETSLASDFSAGIRSPISNHKPRKGTETLKYFVLKIQKIERFQTTNPARGRKLRVLLLSTADTFHFKPQTPQGDGNTTPPGSITMRSGTISNHKPRKGTETRRTRTAFHRP